METLWNIWNRWLSWLDLRSVSVMHLALLTSAALSVIYFAGDGIQSLAPYAFALGKLALIAIAWELFDRLRFRAIDIIEEVRDGNIAAALLALAIALLLHTVFGNI